MHSLRGNHQSKFKSIRNACRRLFKTPSITVTNFAVKIRCLRQQQAMASDSALAFEGKGPNLYEVNFRLSTCSC